MQIDSSMEATAGGLRRSLSCPGDRWSSVQDVLLGQEEELLDPSLNRDLKAWWNWKPNISECGGIVEGGGPDKKIADAMTINLTPNVTLEVIIADLHDIVVNSCRTFLSELGLTATVTQEPIQSTILRSESREQRDGWTYVVFGGYGNGAVNSGLQKQLNEAFGDQMKDLRKQAMATGRACGYGISGKDYADELDINMANRGHVWLANPAVATPTGSLKLISCAAYPRNQDPSEQENIRDMFYKALIIAVDDAMSSAGRRHQLSQPQNRNTNVRKNIRIITHAMGSFVGHNNPSVFSEGISLGLMDFVNNSSGAKA